MAEWSKTKVDPSNLNNGQEYTKNDNVSLEELNSIVNNSLYASDVAYTANVNSENAIATANEALEQTRSTGTRVTVGGEFQATFDADTKADKTIVDNLRNDITNMENDVDNLKSKISLPLGMIFPSAIPLTGANLHLLDGSTISQDGVYSEFVDYLETQISAGYDLTCTQTEFDTDVANTGNCGKFVIDDDAGTIRLPKITRFIQGLDNLTNIGKSLEAGLPNVSGSIDVRAAVSGSTFTNYVGALANEEHGSSTKWGNGFSISSTSQNLDMLTFDASKSNSVYGNSDTVQPQATQYPYYIVLATSSKTDVQVDIDNVVTDINQINSNIDNVVTDINQINSNIDKLTPVTLYDFTSDDADINWGYTSGIQGGVTVSDKSFGQFSKLRITAFFVKEQFVFEFPLKGKSVDYMWASASGGIAYDQAGIMGCVVKTNSTQTTFNVITIGNYNTSGWQARNSNSLYFVGKIEGVY